MTRAQLMGASDGQSSSRRESKMLGIETATTCGAACWYAREEVCRCSCHGANHGVLLMGGEQPRRNCRIQDQRYVLGMVGSYSECEKAMRDFGYSEAAKTFRTTSYGYSYFRSGEPGAPMWRKVANDSQIAKWPELCGCGRKAAWDSNASLLWTREDVAATFDTWLETYAPETR